MVESGDGNFVAVSLGLGAGEGFDGWQRNSLARPLVLRQAQDERMGVVWGVRRWEFVRRWSIGSCLRRNKKGLGVSGGCGCRRCGE